LWKPQTLLMKKVKQNLPKNYVGSIFCLKKQPANFAGAKKTFLCKPQTLLMEKVKQLFAYKLCARHLIQNWIKSLAQNTQQLNSPKV